MFVVIAYQLDRNDAQHSTKVTLHPDIASVQSWIEEYDNDSYLNQLPRYAIDVYKSFPGTSTTEFYAQRSNKDRSPVE